MERRNRSVFGLLVYCFSATLAAGLALAILLAAAAFVFDPALEASSGHLRTVSTAQEFSGVITDSRCGARHLRNSGRSSAECVRACVRRGAKYILVDGDATYVLAGNSALLDGLAGERAHISGTLEGDVLAVTAGVAASQ